MLAKLHVLKSNYQGDDINVHRAIVRNVSSGVVSRKSSSSKDVLNQSNSTRSDKGEPSCGNAISEADSLGRPGSELEHVHSNYNGIAEENASNSMYKLKEDHSEGNVPYFQII